MLVAAAALLGLGGGPALATADPEPAPTLARVSMRITSSSDWTVVHLGGTSVVNARIRGASSNATVDRVHDGWAVRNRGTAPVTVDVEWLAQGAGTSSTLPLQVTKGWRGGVDVSVQPRPMAVAPVTVHNDLQKVTDPTNALTVAVPRRTIFTGAGVDLPRADARRLALAFYYPWFSSYGDGRLADRPTDPRSVWDGAGVRSMLRQAKGVGLDGFVVSWSGNAKDGPGFRTVLGGAAETGMVVSPYLETVDATSSLVKAQQIETVTQWLTQALAYSSSPAFLKANDVPVVFVYQMARLSPADWKIVLARLAALDRRVRLVGDAPLNAYRSVEWGVHKYGANEHVDALTWWSTNASMAARSDAMLDGGAPSLVVGSVSPGYDDRRLRGATNPIVDRGPEGERYDDTWDAALAGTPDWVVVTSWNEWFEGTSIEPGVTTGARSLAQTLDRTQRWREAAPK
ncbi:MAG: hypothetical protein JWN29_3471 [Acidimicrobiales bacterium]|nr:hypothetical protein [Acidimicrobiales bacterium]